MNYTAGLDVSRDARVHVTDLGSAYRIDLNMLGARLGPEPAGGWGPWSREQNRRLCDFMAAEAARRGGSLDSVAEWTVAVNARYDLKDMREVRTSRFRPDFRSAITTLPWGNPASAQSVAIQAVAFVPKDPRAHFAIRAWQPKCLYDGTFLGLATAVVVEIGAVSHVYIAGVVAWDHDIKPLAGDDPRKQMRIVLQMIQEVLAEAGGNPADVVRLRPFTASPAVAQMVREECTQLWSARGYPAPTLLVAEDSSFWDAPSLHAEIQAMGIVGRAGVVVGQDEPMVSGVTSATTRIRRTSTPEADLFHVADLRAPGGTAVPAEATVVGNQVTTTLQALGLAPDDVCLAIIYGSSPESLVQLQNALRGHVSSSAMHCVHCPPMAELAGGTLKVELTARKQKPSAAAGRPVTSPQP